MNNFSKFEKDLTNNEGPILKGYLFSSPLLKIGPFSKFEEDLIKDEEAMLEITE